MILILSDEYDFSTAAVMDWLYFWEKKVLRFGKNDKITIQKILFERGRDIDISLKIKDTQFLLSSIECFWYRRGEINIESFIIDNSLLETYPTLQSHVNLELNAIKEFLYFAFSRVRHLSSILTSKPNKLIQLKLASEVGLDIPETLITSSKISMQEFAQKNSFVTKSINESPYLNIDRTTNLIGYTSEVPNNILDVLPESFFPSLLQQKIEKVFELRVFILNQKFFSMAIFSQLDEKTAVDFRKYNFKKMSRNVPYELPLSIKKRLIKLMERLRLNTASIDMVYDNNNRYVFLEANPIGQFGMTSQPCNFNLEFEIAKYLCNKD